MHTRSAVRPQSAQHVKLDVPDHPVHLLPGQRGGVGPGAVFAVLLVGEADETELRVGGYVLQRLGGIEEGCRPRRVVVGPVGGRGAVVVGGEHQNIRVRGGGLLYGDDIVSGPPLTVSIGLEGDRIPHLLKAPLQVLDGVCLPLGADGAVGSGEDIQIGPKLADIRQGDGLLQHHQRLGHCDGAVGRQLVCTAPGHYARLKAPEHRSPGPVRHRAGIPVLVQSLHRRFR